MRYLVRILVLMVIGVLSFQFVPASGQGQTEKEPWTSEIADGTVITKQDLTKILAEHHKWIETKEKEGLQADLTKAILSDANLTGGDLQRANLTEAKLWRANLAMGWMVPI